MSEAQQTDDAAHLWTSMNRNYAHRLQKDAARSLTSDNVYSHILQLAGIPELAHEADEHRQFNLALRNESEKSKTGCGSSESLKQSVSLRKLVERKGTRKHLILTSLQGSWPSVRNEPGYVYFRSLLSS